MFTGHYDIGQCINLQFASKEVRHKQDDQDGANYSLTPSHLICPNTAHFEVISTHDRSRFTNMYILTSQATA